MTFDEQREVIWSWCRSLGIPYSEASSPQTFTDPFQWDGYVLRGRMFGAHWASPADLCHEIAHWLCAWPTHRRYKGFGMGGPNAGPRVSMIAERTAGAIGILLLRRLDLLEALANAERCAWSSDDRQQTLALRAHLTTVGGRRAVKLLRAIDIEL